MDALAVRVQTEFFSLNISKLSIKGLAMVPDTEETLMYLIFTDTVLYYLPSDSVIIDLNEDSFFERERHLNYLFIYLVVHNCSSFM